LRAVGDAEAESQSGAAKSIGFEAASLERLERPKMGELGVAGCGVRDGERDEWWREEGELAAGEQPEGDAR